MTETVRVLYAEDNPLDADLTRSHLEQYAPDIKLEVVDNGQRCLARVTEQVFDVLLLDNRLPDIDGVRILQELTLREASPPVVIITGRGDEDAAVAALKHGAYDYIIKRDNYLTQLPYALEHAIHRFRLVRANRRLETELVERQRIEDENARLLGEVLSQRRRMDEIIDSVPGVVWEASGRPGTAEQRLNFISQWVERVLGYSVEQWLSKPHFAFSVVHPEDRNRVALEIAEYFTTGQGGIGQFRCVAKDGRTVWVEARTTVTTNDKGQPVGLRGVAMDITAITYSRRRTVLKA